MLLVTFTLTRGKVKLFFKRIGRGMGRVSGGLDPNLLLLEAYIFAACIYFASEN